MNRRDVLAGGLAALSAAMAAPGTLAYPDRAIRLVVPFSPGGATDVVGRLWAEKMKPFLGTVVTENRGGGGGVTGATEVARAQPDGHTFLFGNTSTQVLIPAIMHNPPYDPLKDFVGIYILCNAPTSIVVHESVTLCSRRRGQRDHRPHRRGHAPRRGGCGRSAHPGGVRFRADPRFGTRPDAAIHQRGACALDADHEGDRLQNGMKGNPWPAFP